MAVARMIAKMIKRFFMVVECFGRRLQSAAGYRLPSAVEDKVASSIARLKDGQALGPFRL